MFEVLVYMFENYIDTHARPDEYTLSKELVAAGFDEQDINGAFHWFNQLERKTSQPDIFQPPKFTSTRIFTEDELKKVTLEIIGFILFLEQANILNSAQREIILELAMHLPQAEISVDEIRWIVLMTTWGAGQSGKDHTKDYLFIEDVLMSKQKPTLH